MPSAEINIVLAGLTDLTTKVVQGLVLDISADLKETTPVDTGWARANWVPSVGIPYESDGINANKAAASVQEQAAIQTQGEAKIANYKLEEGACYVSNNVPYIRRLNEGYSMQAPAGFVEAAIEKSVAKNFGGK